MATIAQRNTKGSHGKRGPVRRFEGSETRSARRILLGVCPQTRGPVEVRTAYPAKPFLRREVLSGLHEQVLNQLAFIELRIDMQFFTKNIYTRSGGQPVEDSYTDILRKLAGPEIKRKTRLVAFNKSHTCLVSKTPFRRSEGSDRLSRLWL